MSDLNFLNAKRNKLREKSNSIQKSFDIIANNKNTNIVASLKSHQKFLKEEKNQLAVSISAMENFLTMFSHGFAKGETDNTIKSGMLKDDIFFTCFHVMLAVVQKFSYRNTQPTR